MRINKARRWVRAWVNKYILRVASPSLNLYGWTFEYDYLKCKAYKDCKQLYCSQRLDGCEGCERDKRINRSNKYVAPWMCKVASKLIIHSPSALLRCDLGISAIKRQCAGCKYNIIGRDCNA